MTTIKELAKYIGKEGYINYYDLRINVKVLDIKMAYGRTRFQITPLSGSGEEWAENIKFDDQDPDFDKLAKLGDKKKK